METERRYAVAAQARWQQDNLVETLGQMAEAAKAPEKVTLFEPLFRSDVPLRSKEES